MCKQSLRNPRSLSTTWSTSTSTRTLASAGSWGGLSWLEKSTHCHTESHEYLTWWRLTCLFGLSECSVLCLSIEPPRCCFPPPRDIFLSISGLFDYSMWWLVGSNRCKSFSPRGKESFIVNWRDYALSGHLLLVPLSLSRINVLKPCNTGHSLNIHSRNGNIKKSVAGCLSLEDIS
jgi:hypothetical protein